MLVTAVFRSTLNMAGYILNSDCPEATPRRSILSASRSESSNDSRVRGPVTSIFTNVGGWFTITIPCGSDRPQVQQRAGQGPTSKTAQCRESVFFGRHVVVYTHRSAMKKLTSEQTTMAPMADGSTGALSRSTRQ